MYERLIKLFQLKREAALLMKEMGYKTCTTETLIILAIASDAFIEGSITEKQCREISLKVNKFCDSL